MTDNKKTLHFNFTPVQSFVAQARRTRDLWAGSYLLSWLSGQAMVAIQKGKGEILMPSIEGDQLIAAIKDPSKAISQDANEKFTLAQSLGTLPNRFMAQMPENLSPDDYAQFVEDNCVKVIQAKWVEVANAVRNKIDSDKLPIDDEFWNRQIKNHWEFAWAIGAEDESHLLDTRKNLRLPRPTEECGEKCTVCGERQELSESKKTEFKPNRKDSKAWWGKLQQSNLDLRENERLCAVCLTKRLFPLVAKEAIGWKVEQYYPSTAYLSAIDWLDDVLEKAKTDEATRNAANELARLTDEQLKIHNSEYNTHIQCLSDHRKDSGIDKTFIDLDGNVFYLAGIASDSLQKRYNNVSLLPPEKRKLSEALTKLQKAVGTSATPFYALLLMDGDGMGKLISGRSNKDERGDISKALADFTSRVPDIVNKNNGKLIYAGGDDVFALLPVSTAIKCAAECRAAYQNAFDKQPEEIKKAATISAAVQFAHQNIALSVVVQDAHRLLDDVAKERTGRDALACRVWKPGGMVLTWSQPWDVSETGGQTVVDLIDQVIEDFHPDSPTDRFSSKFFHKLGDLFELVQSDNNTSTGNSLPIKELLVAEYLANREHNWADKDQKQQRDQAEQRIERLLLLCRQQARIIKNEEIIYNADAALLVRFLVQKEV